MSVVSFIAFIHFIRRAWFLARRPAGRPAGCHAGWLAGCRLASAGATVAIAGSWFVASGRPASWGLVCGRPAGWLAGCEIAGRRKLAIQDCRCSSKCWLCKQCPGFLFLSSVKSGPELVFVSVKCLHSCLPSFCSKKRPSSRVSSVFVRHMLFLFAFLFRIAQCMTQTCEDHCDLWVL